MSYEVVSQFMDMQFNFSNDYKFTTFFNYCSESQWTLFFPNEDSVSVNCKTPEELSKVMVLSKKFNIKDNYRVIELPNNLGKITKLSFKKDLILNFENNIFLNLNNCIWRLEKNGLYQIGYMDQLDDKQKVENRLNQLLNLRLLRTTALTPFFDTQFEFENGFIIKTFSCFKKLKQWHLLDSHKNETYSAKIVFVDSSC